MDKEQTHSILIVDDVVQNIQVIANILDFGGYKIAFAQSGKEAIERVEQNKFDLILLDVMMPQMDGFETAQKLKQMPLAKDIPIMFLTARDDDDSIIKGFELGAVDYVTKPFNSAELIARIKTHIRLRKAEANLRESNRAKDKFFSIIARDLRNPFANVIESVNFIMENDKAITSPDTKTHLKQIADTARNGFLILENLLEWSQSQTGKIGYKPEKFSVNELIDKILIVFKSDAKKKDILLYKFIYRELSVYADKDMIKTVLRNLTSNAIKYTERGGEVTISAEEMDDYIEIAVVDTGIGIARDRIPKLFRIDETHITAGTSNEKGTGLGLLLCKELIEKNKGKIFVESTPGEGSKFKFTIPKDKNASNSD